jgi:hypothetical protein
LYEQQRLQCTEHALRNARWRRCDDVRAMWRTTWRYLL